MSPQPSIITCHTSSTSSSACIITTPSSTSSTAKHELQDPFSDCRASGPPQRLPTLEELRMFSANFRLNTKMPMEIKEMVGKEGRKERKKVDADVDADLENSGFVEKEG
jgi:hypothetical protein